MSQSYYILEDGQEKGPFDLVAVVKKIRNGKLHPYTLMLADGMHDAVPASQLNELATFFAQEAPQPLASSRPRPDEAPTTRETLKSQLEDAWVFFGENQTISLVAGGLAIAGLIVGLILSAILPTFISALFAAVVGACLFYAFMAFIFLKIENEETGAATWKALIRQRGVDLLVAAAISAGLPLGLPAAAGTAMGALGFVFMLPGFVLFNLFIFAPLFLMTHNHFSVIDALNHSLQWNMGAGGSMMLRLAALVGINLLATLVLFVPVFVTLPLTAIVLVDLYKNRVIDSAA